MKWFNYKNQVIVFSPRLTCSLTTQHLRYSAKKNSIALDTRPISFQGKAESAAYWHFSWLVLLTPSSSCWLAIVTPSNSCWLAVVTPSSS